MVQCVAQERLSEREANILPARSLKVAWGSLLLAGEVAFQLSQVTGE